MDLLLLPQDPIHHRARVPYVGEPYTQGTDFLTYPAIPENRQWAHVLPAHDQITFAVHEGFRPSDVTSLESFFQTWLFFGLLQEFLSENFEAKHYQDEDDHGRYVHTRNLGDVIVKRIEAIGKSSLEHQGQVKTRLLRCVFLAHHSLRALDPQAGIPGSGHPDFNPSIRDSIISICAAISSIGDHRIDEVPPFTDWPKFEGHLRFTQEQRDAMRQNGWCPSLIAQEDANKSPAPYKHFIKNLKIPKSFVDVDHATCDEFKCDHAAIRPDEYVVRHTKDSCTCAPLAVPLEDIYDCLDGGTFPVIHMVEKDVEDLRVELVPFSKGVQYVALSHVWADGLGNPLSNALPRCQLQRLQDLLVGVEQVLRPSGTAEVSSTGSQNCESSPNKLCLWCDTLLVPVCNVPSKGAPRQHQDEENEADKKSVEGKRAKKYWNAAMELMRDVYTKASAVLVLESSLEAIPVSGVGIIEASIRFHVNQYNRRLWTFQEASLAQNLLIQFKDRVVSAKDMHLEINRLSKSHPLMFDLGQFLVSRYVKLRSFKSLENAGGPDIFQLYLAIRERQCTKSSDEALCISTIMNVQDRQTILDATQAEKRMAALWNALSDHVHGVHRDIIFSQFPRIESVPGYRWAPSTFRQDLAAGERFLSDPKVSSRAEVVPDVGLRVRYSGYRVGFGIGDPGATTPVHVGFLGNLQPKMLHLKLASGEWCTLSSHLNHLSESSPQSVYEYLAERFKNEWYLVRSSKAEFANMTVEPALLGTRQLHTAGKYHVLRTQMLVGIRPLGPLYTPIMLAAERIATGLRTHPDCATWPLTKSFHEALKQGSALENQTPEVQRAIEAISTVPGSDFQLMAYVVLQFIGLGLTVQEEFSDQTEWIVD